MLNRRDFMRLTALGGGAVLASALPGCEGLGGPTAPNDFLFVQLSDSHWGYKGMDNPEAGHTLADAVSAVNALPVQPEFIVFTGDLTHTTDDVTERRRRMTEFKGIIANLKVQQIHFMPGEHDAGLDGGAVYREMFGPSHYTFDYRGVHFIALDNVSAPGSTIGEEQLGWLKADLDGQSKSTPIVVLTHRPLFDLEPKWDWATRDGDKAIALLMPFENVTVFYGHIHQENHHMTGRIAHHSAKSLVFPLPAPGSQEKRTALPWIAQAPDHGLGFREVKAQLPANGFVLDEYNVRPV